MHHIIVCSALNIVYNMDGQWRHNTSPALNKITIKGNKTDCEPITRPQMMGPLLEAKLPGRTE